MLENLYIKDFILIDQLSIDFQNNFSSFTGETGAGKSIFIDCIAALAGDRLNTSIIRKGAKKAIIEGSFSVNKETASLLEEAGYDSESLIVTREINTEGKSTVRINQRLATVGFLKQLMENSIDIHSQHDNQYLLNEKYHLQLLDQYCQNSEKLKQLSDLYKTYHDLQKEYDDLVNTSYNDSQMEIIRYQLDEINKADIKDIHEDDDIQEKLKLAANQEKIQETIEEIKELFSNEGILDKLYQFTKLSHNLSNFSDISTNIDNITNAYYSINDDYETIIDKVGSNELDENDINDLNQRLYDLQRLKRKYNTSLQGLLDHKDELQKEVDNYDNKDFVLGKLNQKKEKALKEYMSIAEEISNDRKKKAEALNKEILQQLKDLSLQKARFEVRFNTIAPTSKGIDEVAFMVAMNTGSDFQPLAKVASGGELSRLMLGLKVIFAKLQHTELVVFDEIDTGVSGPVAFNIGIKMANLAKDMQVFAVTHLPSVAACSDEQYLISKTQNEDSTNTTVQQLDYDQRIEQLAILSSSSTSQASLAAAKELLDNAQKRARE